MIPTDVPPFRAFSAAHFAALAAIAVLVAVMVYAARRRMQPLQRILEVTLAVLLIIQWPISFWVAWDMGYLTVNNAFPLHLCDLGAILGIVALLTHKRGLFEMVYFWGLAGTLQGLITPALTQDWPHPRYFLFFVNHGGVVAAGLYGVLGLGFIPRRSAKWRAWFYILGYALVVGLFNWVVGSNYGFLRHKPETASLFDALGPWPWYIGVTSLLALVFFILLDLPFIRLRRRR
ncbi:putative integral membrane protein (TIGR02206 family) [Roseimicrobium gellanilyticum]|uniref:Putative integral membrane protein (TIGR02206 family) n=1 Tax=Roseimicrobium gellanilyticum TaxID=748857 RepID=A0A366HA10_9BACT|nr:TIGR02206 family membrane protein [Roseimicrobium gellanilyticum]RBP39045.1 putative integral membrane protein (TIGR02206 family) [Roseimicrobium gellanilyticum]